MASNLISGDWLYDESRNLHRAYEGEVTGSWSGGVEWVASRKVAEAIVADQQAIRADYLKKAPDMAHEIADLAWDGDTLVLTDNFDVTRIDADEQGRYAVGFGWVWGEVEVEECHEIVSGDGYTLTVDSRPLAPNGAVTNVNVAYPDGSTLMMGGVTVFSQKPLWPKDAPHIADVSWPSIGSVSPDKAKAFARAVELAATIAAEQLAAAS